jgi:hypothetical protein
MVDGLIGHTLEFSISTLIITAANIFVKEGHLQPPGLIENIAQTCGLRAGYEQFQALNSDANVKPPLGYIGEVKNLAIHSLPPVGVVLRTRVDLLHTVFQSSIIRGTIMVEDSLIATCEMKIFGQS